LNLNIARQIPLFNNLPDGELQALIETSEECGFQSGEILLQEDSKSEYFFILIEGEVEIIKSLGTPDARQLAIRREGAILGEMSKFSPNGTHTASVVTHTLCKLLKVPFTWLDSVIRHHPDLAYKLMRLYSSRLDSSENQTIQELREKNRQLTQAYNDLKIAQAAMIEKEKMEQEMCLAGKIQHSILPKTLPVSPGLDFGALMIPAKQVGGDFYDFIHLDDQRVGIVIGDVCDKGMPAALLMALSYSSVRMEALRNHNPGDTLRAVNRHLIQIECSDMFVTLIYGILDCKTLKFEYARAGHTQPLLLDESHRPLPVPHRLGQAVGIFDHFELDEGCISIPKSGTLLLYSDGLSETIDDQPGSEGLSEMCASIVNTKDITAQACCEGLWKTAGGSSGQSLIKDDFTVVVIKSREMDGSQWD
jgi:serine phosphatase RsbU (regulator of sigma subunit)